MMEKKFIFSLFSSLLLLFASIVTNFYAGNYATRVQSNSVTDVILSNIPVFQVENLFVYGSFLFFILLLILCLLRPKTLPFTLKSIAVFTLVRAVFISLTHIGSYPTSLTIDPLSFIHDFAFGGDLFFSGHTGLPFLMAIIFWPNKYLRWIFITTSICFGAIVLMGHLHYSIDVLAAFFISYSIAHLTKYIFQRDYLLFLSDRELF
ncbi:sphingomyelin synthase family protein [Candidatus Gracilibacteria bacterium]|nr:sphingomyelin synthase family protein [Candidatus Gracilibacteria bacterium]MCF7856194.1 sphingomyelin synthase family protein [Candidatus Gracilibacteria bacterium]MCF7896466.1 sphingomyelin synthase family protein [Candidatus Gracilibacteria bacterium]